MNLNTLAPWFGLAVIVVQAVWQIMEARAVRNEVRGLAFRVYKLELDHRRNHPADDAAPCGPMVSPASGPVIG